jgi:hypothetical protein
MQAVGMKRLIRLRFFKSREAERFIKWQGGLPNGQVAEIHIGNGKRT